MVKTMTTNRYGEEQVLSRQAFDYIDGVYREAPSQVNPIQVAERYPIIVQPTDTGLLGNVAQALMPTNKVLESATPLLRSQGVLLRMAGIVVISLPISYGLVRIVLGEAALAPILLLWGIVGVGAGIWLNNTDYLYSANGVELEKVGSATEIALSLIKREYALREKTLDTYAQLQHRTLDIESEQRALPNRMPFDTQKQLTGDSEHYD